MTIAESFDLYRIDVIVYGNQSPKTEENHSIVKKNLIEYFGDIDICSIDFPMIRDWKLNLDKGRSSDTVRNYIIKLRVVLAYLRKCGIQCIDPDQVTPPKRQHKVPEFITKEEVSRLIDCTNKVRNKAIISLLYASGIRVSELCSLNRDSIKDNRFTVVGKGGKARLCFSDERTALLIKKYLRTRKDDNHALFVSHKGRVCAGNIQEIFKYARKKADLPNVHPHTMRHSFATNLLSTNMNVRHVQSLLGHASLDTTMLYMHVMDFDLERAYKEHHSV